MGYYSLSLIYGLIFSIHIPKGNGLQCYDCKGNSVKPDNCLDVNENTPKKPAPNSWFKGKKDACVVSRGTYQGIKRVARQATEIDKTDTDGTQHCQAIILSSQYANVKDPECHVCFTDLCNSSISSSISRKPVYFLFYIAIVGILVNFYRTNFS